MCRAASCSHSHGDCPCRTHGRRSHSLVFFFFNDTATTEIYTLSLHDALPICRHANEMSDTSSATPIQPLRPPFRSEEHTSELQSQSNLVCRLLLEKKKTKKIRLFSEKKKKNKNTII